MVEIRTREEFLRGPWERCVTPEIPPVSTRIRNFSSIDLDRHSWPTEGDVTTCETINKVRQTPVRWQTFSNHRAIEWLQRIQAGPLKVEDLKESEEAEAWNSILWSDITVVSDELADAKSMTARHTGDVTTRAIFRLEDGVWQYEPDDFDEGEFNFPPTTTFQFRYRERGRKYFLKGGGGPPEVYLSNKNESNPRWRRVVTEPDKISGLDGVLTHVNSALGGDPDGARWVFKKCFKISSGPMGRYGTGMEPRNISQAAVKLYVCLAPDGNTIDVSETFPKKMYTGNIN
jgi:hypothetical protein